MFDDQGLNRQFLLAGVTAFAVLSVLYSILNGRKTLPELGPSTPDLSDSPIVFGVGIAASIVLVMWLIFRG